MASSGFPSDSSLHGGVLAATTPHFAAAAAGAGPALRGSSYSPGDPTHEEAKLEPVADFIGSGVEQSQRARDGASSPVQPSTVTSAGLPVTAASRVALAIKEATKEDVGFRNGVTQGGGTGGDAEGEDDDGHGDEGGHWDDCCAVEGKHLGVCGWNWHHWVVFWARTVAFSPLFEGFIVLCIVVSGALVGVQLYPIAKEPSVAEALSTIDTIVVVIFTVEVCVKLLAEGASVVEFFRSPSNNLDFVIVVLSFVPFQQSGDRVGTATLIRAIRLLRLLKLVKAVPPLRVLVMGMAESVSAIGYIFALLLLLIFIYGVAGNSWFAENDPFNFGTLDQAMITVFRAVTLEDISDLLYRAVVGCDLYPLPARQELCVNPQPQPALGSFFILSISVLGNLILLNLTVAVVVMAHGRATEQIRAEQALEAEERRAKVRELILQRDQANARRARSRKGGGAASSAPSRAGSGADSATPEDGKTRARRMGAVVTRLALWAAGASHDKDADGDDGTASSTGKSDMLSQQPEGSVAGVGGAGTASRGIGPLSSAASVGSGSASLATPKAQQAPHRPALESTVRARGALLATRAFLPRSGSSGRQPSSFAGLALAAGATGRAVTSVAAGDAKRTGLGLPASPPQGGDAGGSGSGGGGGSGSTTTAARMLRAAALARVRDDSPDTTEAWAAPQPTAPAAERTEQGDAKSAAVVGESPVDGSASPAAATATPPLRLVSSLSPPSQALPAFFPSSPPSGDHKTAAGADGSAKAAESPSPKLPPPPVDLVRQRSQDVTMRAINKAKLQFDADVAEAEASRRLAAIAGLVADAAEALESLAPIQADLDASTLVLHAVVDDKLRPRGVRGWVTAAGEVCPTPSRRFARCCGWSRLEEAAQEVTPPSARRRRSLVFLDEDEAAGDTETCCEALFERARDCIEWFPCKDHRVRRVHGLTSSFWSPARGAVAAVAAFSKPLGGSAAAPRRVQPGSAIAIEEGGSLNDADRSSGQARVRWSDTVGSIRSSDTRRLPRTPGGIQASVASPDGTETTTEEPSPIPPIALGSLVHRGPEPSLRDATHPRSLLARNETLEAEERQRKRFNSRAKGAVRVLQAVSALEGDRTTVMDLGAKRDAEAMLARERGEDVKPATHAAVLQSTLEADIERQRQQTQPGVSKPRKPFASFVRPKAAHQGVSLVLAEASGEDEASTSESGRALVGSSASARASTAAHGDAASTRHALQLREASACLDDDSSDDSDGDEQEEEEGEEAEARAGGHALPAWKGNEWHMPADSAAPKAAAASARGGGGGDGQGKEDPWFGEGLSLGSGGVGGGGGIGSGTILGFETTGGGELLGFGDNGSVGFGADSAARGQAGGGGTPTTPKRSTRPDAVDMLALGEGDARASHGQESGRLSTARSDLSRPLSRALNSARPTIGGGTRRRVGFSQETATAAGGISARQPPQHTLGGSFRKLGSPRVMAKAQTLEDKVARAATRLMQSRRLMYTHMDSARHGREDSSDSEDSGEGVAAQPASRRALLKGSTRKLGQQDSKTRGRPGLPATQPALATAEAVAGLSKRALVVPQPADSKRRLRMGSARKRGKHSGRRAGHGGDDNVDDDDEDRVVEATATRFRRINTAAQVLAAVGPRTAAAQRRARTRVITKSAGATSAADAAAVADTLREVARAVAEEDAHIALRATHSFQYQIASAAGAGVAMAAARKGISGFRRALGRSKAKQERSRLVEGDVEQTGNDHDQGHDTDDEEWLSAEEDEELEAEAKSLLVESWPEEHRAHVLRGVRIVATMLLSQRTRQLRKWKHRWRRLAAESEDRMARADMDRVESAGSIRTKNSSAAPPTSGERLRVDVDEAVERELDKRYGKSKRRLL